MLGGSSVDKARRPLNRYYLWWAVDSEGMILDILLQARRNAKATKRFFNHVLHTTPTRPWVIVTDGLRSYNIISRKLLQRLNIDAVSI